MTTDTSEKGLERLICTALTGAACDPPQGGAVRERPSNYCAGWICGDPQDYDREYCVDLAQLSVFLHATQPNAAESLDLGQDSPTRRRFAAIIDEAHSSQGGRTSASVSMALGEAGAEDEEETTEDKINRLMESKKLLPKASYFAFTATLKIQDPGRCGTWARQRSSFAVA